MAIIVEDGTVVTGANSYISEAELTAYATARGVTLSGDTEQLLIKAMDYIESLDFIGLKYVISQPLQWPRWGVVIDGYYEQVEDIPQLLKDGLAEVAIAIDNGEDPLADIARVKTKVKVGPISTEYAPGQSTSIVRRIDNKLYKILKGSGGGGTSFNVDRG